MTTSFFLHGLDSSSHGTKGSYFRSRFPRMLLPDFFGPLEERLQKLHRLAEDKKDLILIGSSFGGLMATIYAIEHPARVQQVILLAPALNFPDFAKYQGQSTVVPAIVYQGIHDTVTPLIPVQEAAKSIFGNLTFHEVDDDHLLRQTFPTVAWQEILPKAG